MVHIKKDSSQRHDEALKYCFSVVTDDYVYVHKTKHSKMSSVYKYQIAVDKRRNVILVTILRPLLHVRG